LNVFPIRIPPLRERADDIPLLVEYSIYRYAKKAGKKFRAISKKTLELFETYDWPGNIRELQNVIALFASARCQPRSQRNRHVNERAP
jgi:formate hydrogenlyase transcriptional activator